MISYNVYRCWVSEFQALPELDANANAVAIQTIKLENEGWERDLGVTEPKEPTYLEPPALGDVSETCEETLGGRAVARGSLPAAVRCCGEPDVPARWTLLERAAAALPAERVTGLLAATRRSRSASVTLARGRRRARAGDRRSRSARARAARAAARRQLECVFGCGCGERWS